MTNTPNWNLPYPIGSDTANIPAVLGALANAIDSSSFADAGYAIRKAVRVVSTANIDLSAPGANIDGVAMIAGDRFLAVGQSTAHQNRIWVWNGAAVAATAPTDFDAPTDFSDGVIVGVSQGTDKGGSVWHLNTPGSITLGTTSLTWKQIAGPGAIAADSIADSLKPSEGAAAGDEALRALGTTAGTAAAGNDSRLSDSRTPSGSAGGDLAGTYPNPSIGSGKVTASNIAASLKPSGSAATTDEALRALGTTAGTAAAGNDSRLSDTRTPTDGSVTLAKLSAAIKPSGSAAAGDEAVRALGTTADTACAGNDSRLSNTRTPTDGSVTAAKIAAALKPSGTAATTDEALRALGTAAGTACAGDDTRLLPTGAITAFAGTTAPSGWELCAGQSVLRTGAYANLFALIGTTFGSVDGTHFNLPDLRGRVPVGLDNLGGSDGGRLSVSNTLGGSGGEEKHALTGSEMPTHTHTIGEHTHLGIDHLHSFSGTTAAGSGAASGYTYNGSGVSNQAAAHTHAYSGTTGAADRSLRTNGVYEGVANVASGTAVASANGADHQNMQPYLLLGYIIKL